MQRTGRAGAYHSGYHLFLCLAWIDPGAALPVEHLRQPIQTAGSVYTALAVESDVDR